MPLTSEAARRMISASQEKARELGVAVSTAIVDAEGRLFAFERMEGVPLDLCRGVAGQGIYRGAARA